MRSDALHQFHIAMVYGSYDRDLDHDLGSAALDCICGLHWDFEPFRHAPSFQTGFFCLIHCMEGVCGFTSAWAGYTGCAEMEVLSILDRLDMFKLTVFCMP